MSFELLPKTDSDKMITISVQDMSLLKTLMLHAKVDVPVILKFSSNAKVLIGEKVGKDIATKLQELMPKLTSSNVVVQRKVVTRGKVELLSQPLNVEDLIFVQGFIFFCSHHSPFEIL